MTIILTIVPPGKQNLSNEKKKKKQKWKSEHLFKSYGWISIKKK